MAERITLQVENWRIEEETGYKPMTTIYMDFSIADKFGAEAVKDTFHKVFKEWKKNYKYMTELCLALNWKIWRWYKQNDTLAKIYNDLWHKVNDWCYDNLKDEELEYFYQVTD